MHHPSQVDGGVHAIEMGVGVTPTIFSHFQICFSIHMIHHQVRDVRTNSNCGFEMIPFFPLRILIAWVVLELDSFMFVTVQEKADRLDFSLPTGLYVKTIKLLKN